ncbi:MAG: hypothetical protein ABI723_08455 [Bacteroidia bacterium]
MVEVGFICEGKTEFLIVTSTAFKDFLSKNNLTFINAIDVTGNKNLLPKNIDVFCEELTQQGAEVIFILSDLDLDKCVTITKNRIGSCRNSITIISKKEIESWFLADSKTISGLMTQNYFFEFPEQEIKPIETLKEEFKLKATRGIRNSKIKFALKMINSGFSIENAAQHPNCTSAKYFIEKLKAINS